MFDVFKQGIVDVKFFLMRFVSIFVGFLSLYLLFTNTENPNPSVIGFTIQFIVCFTFVIYGVGGQKLLSKLPLLNFFSKPMKVCFKEKSQN